MTLMEEKESDSLGNPMCSSRHQPDLLKTENIFNM